MRIKVWFEREIHGPLQRCLKSRRLQTRWSRAWATVVVITAASACASGVPPYAGLEPASIYDYALEKFEEGNWREAARAFEHLATAHPTDPRAIEARFLIGQARFNDEEYITAISEYTRILDRAPGHELAPKAALGVCQSYAALSPIPERDQGFTETARDECTNVELVYPTSPEALEARQIRQQMLEKLAEKKFEWAEYYRSRDALDSANLYYEAIANEFATTTWAPKALLSWYEALLVLEYDDEARGVRDRLVRFYPTSNEARLVADSGGSEGRVRGS